MSSGTRSWRQHSSSVCRWWSVFFWCSGALYRASPLVVSKVEAVERTPPGHRLCSLRVWILASSAPNALAYSVEGVDWCSVDQPAKGVARLRGPAAAEFGVEAVEPVDDGPWQF